MSDELMESVNEYFNEALDKDIQINESALHDAEVRMAKYQPIFPTDED